MSWGHERWRRKRRSLQREGPVRGDEAYVWADGIHVNIRRDEERLCLLVLIGVRADGTTELIASTDRYLRGASDRAIAHQTRHRSLAPVGRCVRIHNAWTDNAATTLGL